MSRTFFFKSCFTVSIALGLGCESADRGSSAAATPSSMGSSLGALAAAVSGCAEERDSCEANLADATVDRSCQDAFQSCKKAALDGAMPDLTKGVHACAEQARECRETAADEGAKSACRDTLKACVGEHDEADDDERGESDGGAHNGEHSPVVGCTRALRTCIEGEQQSKLCTDALRVCLDTTLPNRGKAQESGADAGSADAEHGHGDGKPDEHDRGASEQHKPTDAGVVRDVDVGDPSKKPGKAERDGGRAKPQA